MSPAEEYPACPACETDVPVVGNQSRYEGRFECLRCGRDFDTGLDGAPARAEEVAR